jgi:two-component system CheB/CheR fusion protein
MAFRVWQFTSWRVGRMQAYSGMSDGPLLHCEALVVPPSQDAHARVIGLGASAGGLEALTEFLAAVPPASGLSFVVVQHLAPSKKTMLVALLQRVTAMPVNEATEGMPLAPNAVYVIPPDFELQVLKGQLRLRRPQQPKGLRLPIDVLFSSLAQDQGERAIGVVLSGMGSDGTLGLQEIKSQGGLTLAQQPDTASFAAMPLSAIATGCVDIVALPADMPERILMIAAHRMAPGLRVEGPSGWAAGPSALSRILDMLRVHCRHDLSLYKTNTLERRIERRVAVHGLASMADYARFLSHNPKEMDLLFAEMLIGVTGFFRDPEVWAEIQGQVMPDLMARHSASLDGHTPLRAWVVGCSTGEEAYSLAMVFKEVQAARPEWQAGSLQIFATDLSADAILVARRGLYPAKSLETLSPQRQARFFTPQQGGLQIDKGIRDMVLFAQHDVILDPPFTRLDLLSCRNVLIYFNAELQRRLMPLFHYSLLPQGVLVLGGSETVGRAQSLFYPQNPKTRVYQRSERALHAGVVDFPVNRYAPSRAHPQEPALSTPVQPHPVNLQALADHVLLQAFSPPAVLVNEAGDILYISGRTGKYLEPAAGKANWNIHVMAHRGIRTQLAVAMRQALQSTQPVELPGLKIDEASHHGLHITVQAMREPKAMSGMLMIVFKDVLVPLATHGQEGAPAEAMDAALAAELERSREEIQALRLEMQASKEALQMANEALQSINEELQSANEELTTSKEEAQSMNEELQTINGELQTRLDDLALAQSDMQNLLNSTDIATLFLDNDLNVRRFTEQTTRIFHLRDGDIGRPLTDLANTLSYPDLYADAKETLRTLTPCEKQVSTADGHWYAVRIMPYRTLTNLIQGAVLTFVDITGAKALEIRLRSN